MRVVSCKQFISGNFSVSNMAERNCDIIYILNKHATYFAKFISGGMFDADRNNGQRPKAALWSAVVCLLCCEEKLSEIVLYCLVSPMY